MPRARRQPQPGRRADARRNHVPLVRTRPHAAAVRHGPAHCRRKREGATQFPTIGLFERNANNFETEERAKFRSRLAGRCTPFNYSAAVLALLSESRRRLVAFQSGSRRRSGKTAEAERKTPTPAECELAGNRKFESISLLQRVYCELRSRRMKKCRVLDAAR